jgi:hypothetical protein
MSLKVLKVLLEIEIYLINFLCKPQLSILYLNIINLSPLIIELLFQEFTRLNIKHDDFFRTEF